MPVELVDNWEDKLEFDSRVYPVRPLGKDKIDETFDQLHAEGKMEWSDKPSPFASPVFVV